MMKELVKQMHAIDADGDISSIIITGDRGVFSRGLDLRELSEVKTYGQVMSGRSPSYSRACTRALARELPPIRLPAVPTSPSARRRARRLSSCA